MQADSIDKIITAERKEHPTDSPEDTVKRVTDTLAGRRDAFDLARPAISAYVLTRCRDNVRIIERRVYREGIDKVSISARTQLLQEGFYVNGNYVRFDDATVDDFKARIADMEQQREDLRSSIMFYHQCIEEMQAAHVKRYGDLAKRSRRKAS